MFDTILKLEVYHKKSIILRVVIGLHFSIKPMWDASLNSLVLDFKCSITMLEV